MSEDNAFKVGDRVQYRDEDDETLVGEIKSFRSEDEDGEIVIYATVELDADEGMEEYAVVFLEVEDEESKLEAEFYNLVEDHMKEIEEQLEIAAKAITKAQEISEKYGLPFYAGVSPLAQGYTPGSYYSDFSSLDTDFVHGLTNTFPGGEYHNEGWEHSDVC